MFGFVHPPHGAAADLILDEVRAKIEAIRPARKQASRLELRERTGCYERSCGICGSRYVIRYGRFCAGELSGRKEFGSLDQFQKCSAKVRTG
jgi:hypothetical protein